MVMDEGRRVGPINFFLINTTIKLKVRGTSEKTRKLQVLICCYFHFKLKFQFIERFSSFAFHFQTNGESSAAWKWEDGIRFPSKSHTRCWVGSLLSLGLLVSTLKSFSITGGKGERNPFQILTFSLNSFVLFLFMDFFFWVLHFKCRGDWGWFSVLWHLFCLMDFDFCF